MEVPLTKNLQGNCVGLFKYLILLFFRSLCTWAPKKQAESNQCPTSLRVRCFLEQSPTEVEAAGEGARWRCRGTEIS